MSHVGKPCAADSASADDDDDDAATEDCYSDDDHGNNEDPEVDDEVDDEDPGVEEAVDVDDRTMRNSFSETQGPGLRRALAVYSCVLETSVEHEGKEKGIFDPRAMTAVTDEAADVLMQKRLTLPGTNTALFKTVLTGLTVRRLVKKALARAVQLESSAKRESANGSSAAGCNAELAKLYALLLARKREAKSKKDTNAAKAAAQIAEKKKRRANATMRVSARPAMTKKSRRTVPSGSDSTTQKEQVTYLIARNMTRHADLLFELLKDGWESRTPSAMRRLRRFVSDNEEWARTKPEEYATALEIARGGP